MTGIADDPLRTLRLCDSALKSQHFDGIPRRICRARGFPGRPGAVTIDTSYMIHLELAGRMNFYRNQTTGNGRVNPNNDSD